MAVLALGTLHFLLFVLFFENTTLALNWDMSCHQAFCLQMIVFHWYNFTPKLCLIFLGFPLYFYRRVGHRFIAALKGVEVYDNNWRYSVRWADESFDQWLQKDQLQGDSKTKLASVSGVETNAHLNTYTCNLRVSAYYFTIYTGNFIIFSCDLQFALVTIML